METVVLIAWIAVATLNPTVTSISHEFDSMEACVAAGDLLQEEGKSGKGKDIHWRYICTPR